MKRLILIIVAIACTCVLVASQTSAPSKRRVVKTGTPNGIFSPAIVSGDLVFTSGQIGLDPKTGQFPEGGFEAQFNQVFPLCQLRPGSKAKDHMVTTRGGKMSFLGRGGSGTGRPADIFMIDLRRLRMLLPERSCGC